VRAAQVSAYGPPEQVRIVDLPTPQPKPGQVRVDIHAAAVNYPDLLYIANKYQGSIALPFVPGGEFAGIVSALGEGVSDLRVGDRVRGSYKSGAFAEQIAVGAERLQLLAPDADLEQAAAFFVSHLTAYHVLHSVARLRPSEWVVVLGAAGGVGLAAVDVARHLGGRVIAASRGDKLAACREAGAEVVIDYEREDLKERIRAASGAGASVVVDPVGGPWAEQALRAMRWGGRYVTVGYASGEIPRIPVNLLLLKGVSMMGFAMGPFAEHHPDTARRDRTEVLGLFAVGKLKTQIAEVYPLERIVEALNRVARREVAGKVLIRCRGAVS
jgi:NADPH2:quinone reductase